MVPPENPLFRQAALDRLASPERLDTRPRLPAYTPSLVIAALLLLAAVALFAAWLP